MKLVKNFALFRSCLALFSRSDAPAGEVRDAARGTPTQRNTPSMRRVRMRQRC